MKYYSQIFGWCLINQPFLINLNHFTRLHSNKLFNDYWVIYSQCTCSVYVHYTLIHSRTYYNRKMYFRIDQHLAQYFVNYGADLSSPPPFLWSQTITSFWNSIISSNQETGLEI